MVILHQVDTVMSDEPQAQPFLPRVGMIWFFIAAAIVAVALGVIRAADQGRALQAAVIFTVLFSLLFGCLSALSFLVAYFMGAAERAVAGKVDTPANPFSDGTPPPQIIPPKAVDASA